MNPKAIAPGHNMAGLTNEQVGANRLLDTDEVGVSIRCVPGIQRWEFPGWSTHPVAGSDKRQTYRFNGSRAELRAARDLPPEPAPLTNEARLLAKGEPVSAWQQALQTASDIHAAINRALGERVQFGSGMRDRTALGLAAVIEARETPLRSQISALESQLAEAKTLTELVSKDAETFRASERKLLSERDDLQKLVLAKDEAFRGIIYSPVMSGPWTVMAQDALTFTPESVRDAWVSREEHDQVKRDWKYVCEQKDVMTREMDVARAEVAALTAKAIQILADRETVRSELAAWQTGAEGVESMKAEVSMLRAKLETVTREQDEAREKCLAISQWAKATALTMRDRQHSKEGRGHFCDFRSICESAHHALLPLAESGDNEDWQNTFTRQKRALSREAFAAMKERDAAASDLAAAKSAQAQAERSALESAALVERMREALKDCAEGVLMLSHHLNNASDGPIASDVLMFDRVGPARELYAITPSTALAEYTEKVWREGAERFRMAAYSAPSEVVQAWLASTACAALQKGGQS